MKNVSESGPSGNRAAGPDRLSEPQARDELDGGQPSLSSDFDAGGPVLQPDEADPNLGDLPPDFKNATQATNNAKTRGFNLARTDGSKNAAEAKVEANTDGLIVVAVYESPGLKGKLDCLWGAKTAALVSSLPPRALFFF